MEMMIADNSGVGANNYTSVSTEFSHKSYNVTNYWIKFHPIAGLLLCFSFNQNLDLEAEEAVLHTTTCCATSNERRPYGELGSVDKTTACGCCATFQFGNSSILPQCGCSEELVEEIVTELKARMKSRGDTGQIRRAEEHLAEIQLVKADLANLNAKVDAILTALKIQPPSAVAAASMVERL